jgi:hypothetical protein
MNKENGTYIQWNITQLYKKGNPVICKNMDEPGGHWIGR